MMLLGFRSLDEVSIFRHEVLLEGSTIVIIKVHQIMHERFSPQGDHYASRPPSRWNNLLSSPNKCQVNPSIPSHSQFPSKPQPPPGIIVTLHFDECARSKDIDCQLGITADESKRFERSIQKDLAKVVKEGCGCEKDRERDGFEVLCILQERKKTLLNALMKIKLLRHCRHAQGNEPEKTGKYGEVVVEIGEGFIERRKPTSQVCND